MLSLQGLLFGPESPSWLWSVQGWGPLVLHRVNRERETHQQALLGKVFGWGEGGEDRSKHEPGAQEAPRGDVCAELERP